MHYERMQNTLRAGLLQNGFGVLAVTDQFIPFDRHPKARVARTVQMKPLPFAVTGIERLRGAEFVCHGHNQVLLFREWERFERAENAGLVHDFQLLSHSLIVPCARFRLWREACLRRASPGLVR